MSIEENFNDAFNYAGKLFTDAGRIILLIILAIIPIVNFIVIGYLWRVVSGSPASKDPPPLEDFVGMWIDGLKMLVALLVYMIVPGILIAIAFAVLFAGGIFATLVGGIGLGAIAFGLALLLVPVGLLLGFFAAIIAMMGMVHMVKNNSFGKAFAVGEILKVIERAGWGNYIIWLIVIFVASLVVSALGNIPVIGWLIALIIAPVFGVFAARSATTIYGRGTGAPAPTPIGSPID